MADGTAIKAVMVSKVAMVSKAEDLVNVAVTVSKVAMAAKAVKLPLLRAVFLGKVVTALLNLEILISLHQEIMEIWEELH